MLSSLCPENAQPNTWQETTSGRKVCFTWGMKSIIPGKGGLQGLGRLIALAAQSRNGKNADAQLTVSLSLSLEP